MTAIIFIIFQISHIYLVNSFSNFFFSISKYMYSHVYFFTFQMGTLARYTIKNVKNIYILSFGERSPSSNLSL